MLHGGKPYRDAIERKLRILRIKFQTLIHHMSRAIEVIGRLQQGRKLSTVIGTRRGDLNHPTIALSGVVFHSRSQFSLCTRGN